MAYDENLAARARTALEGLDITERKMFGGVAFMLSGNMCVGIAGDELMVRIAPDFTEEALALAHVREFDMTGKRMRGWVLVGGPAIEADAGLSEWVERGVEYAGSLPPK